VICVSRHAERNPLDESEGQPDYRLGLHELLLRLAGQVPDEALTLGRELLDRGDLKRLARTVTAGILERNVALADEDRDLLVKLLKSTGLDSAVLDDVDYLAEEPIRYTFTPDLDESLAADAEGGSGADPDDDGPDEAAVEYVTSLDSVRGLWRAWRSRSDGFPWPQARRVYVLEVDAGTNPIEVAAHLQRRLIDAGDFEPQVETYLTGTEVPLYQRLARASAELIWSRETAPEVRMARLFDEVHPSRGPLFSAEHELVGDAEERARLVDYLRAGETLLVTAARMDDVVDDDAGYVVPVDFRTDGTWLWTDATTYYLETHHLLPDPELVEHIRSRDYTASTLDGVQIHHALVALQEPSDEEAAWVFGDEEQERAFDEVDRELERQFGVNAEGLAAASSGTVA
jgi:hypothetical protein